MSRYPISLDRPVAPSEDSNIGDLLPDGDSDQPVPRCAQDMLRRRIEKAT